MEPRLVAISESVLPQVRQINSAVMPISYSEIFYRDLLVQHRGSCCGLEIDGSLVGCICCKVDEAADALYVMTLAVLAPFRSQGFGRKLLEWACDHAVSCGCRRIAAHVQSGSPALDFYTANGFAIGDRIPRYYRRLDPADAFYLYREFAGAAVPTRTTTFHRQTGS